MEGNRGHIQKVSITEVLHELRHGHPCCITYVRSTKSRGTLKLIANCTHGFNYKKFTPKQTQDYMTRHRGKHSLMGTIPIIDFDTDAQLTIKISHIIAFNHKKVIH